MNTVGRLGSYITRGVYTVSGPFHPFGGAVDIIAVEQPDGSFKSSPWYISFGKFQGVLKAKEKVVNISVNGVEADFHMYLDQRGEAYFLREVEGEEGESLLSSLSSSDETDGRSMKTSRPVKSKDCNFDSNLLNSGDQDDGGNGKIVVRTKSRRSRIMGSVFGRWSMKEDRIQEGDDGTGIVRIGSLERAEIAADLLELKWSTNLATSKHKKGSGLPFSARSRLDGKGDKDLQIGDERCLVDSSVHDSFKCGMDNGVLAGEIEPRNLEIKGCSELCFGSLGDSVVETSMATVIASLCTTEQVESSMLQEVVVEGRGGVIPEISRSNDKSTSHNADDDDENGEISGVTGHELRMPGVGEACHGKELDDEQTSDEKEVALPGFSISEEDNESNKVQSFICCGTSQSLEVVLNGSNEQTRENGFLAETEPGEVYVQSVTLRATPQLPSEDAANEQAEDVRLEKGNMEASDVSSSQTNPFLCINGHDVSNLDIPVAVLMSDTSTVYVAPMHPLFEATDSQSTDTISSFGNFNYQSKDKKTIRDQTMGNKFQPSLASVMDAELLQVAYSPKRALSAPSSESSEEEQFHFSDLDEFKHDNFLIEKNFANGVDEIGEEVNSLCVTDGEACLSSEKIVQKNDLATSSMETSSTSCPVDVPEVHNVFGFDAGRMVESLPNISSPFGSLDANLHSLSHSLELSSEPVEWPLLRKRDGSYSSNVDASIVDQFMHEPSNDEESLKLDNSESGFASGAAGGPAKVIVDSGGSWRMWPFSLKRSRSRRTIQPASNDTRSSESEIVLNSTSTMETTCSRLENVSNFNMNINTEKNVLKLKATIKMVKAITPTSKQLASLNLKEGRNTVTFTFSTAMLGKQEVDARIYLWKWNTRIVISDVDGTITKSDVLGQFMPLIGVDWSQTGVANLFSAIKENGYQMLFLSARAISQAYHTRRFLFNLKQDGKTLPDGPVVISPDGLFPSLFREVIRRAPHEFKIACLENIKALFPPDCNPFYAGFGNRDTDEISYIKVGIPRGKIFIINPKGEVAVNRRVDTKSYHSLHDLVHGMFPSKPSIEQEDFNSWNYWKLPPPVVDI